MLSLESVAVIISVCTFPLTYLGEIWGIHTYTVKKVLVGKVERNLR